MKRAQNSTATLFNRYAEVFLALRDHIRATRGCDLGGADLRILSFGCSTGAEILTARAYFPDATILGCDIDGGALQTAADVLIDDGARVFHSDAAAIRAFGPYDVVLANSVLCRYPLGEDVTDLGHDFPFSQFADMAGMLTEALAADGALMLVNANYRFRDLPEASSFASLLTPRISGNGFVEKFSIDGKRLTRLTLNAGQRSYVHHVLEPDALSDADFRDCLFLRGGAPSAPPMSAVELPEEGDFLIGSDPRKLPKGAIGAGLFEERTTGALRRQWLKSTLGGETVSLGQWEIPATRPVADDPRFVAPGQRKPSGWLARWFG